MFCHCLLTFYNYVCVDELACVHLQAPVTYNSDHVYPGAVRDGDAAPTVVLYAELGTPEFKQAHQQLVQLADSGKVKNGIKDI